MRTEVPCPRCGEGVYEDSDFCPHCGVLRPSAGAAVCATHPGERATHVCIICHVLLCPRCRKRKGGRSFCQDHRKVEAVLDWANVFQSGDVAESELVSSLLEEEGFTVQKQNFNSSGSMFGTLVARPAKVFVPIPEYLRALECVREWQSSLTDLSTEDDV